MIGRIVRVSDKQQSVQTEGKNGSVIVVGGSAAGLLTAAKVAASGRDVRYGQTLNGNQLNVVAPPPVLKPAAKQTPRVKARLVNPVVETGWQGIKPAEAARLKTSIARQNPPPAGLPKPRIPKKEQVESPTGPRVRSQTQMPPNLVAPKARPSEKMPEVRATPGGSPKTPIAGKKSVPPLLARGRPAH